MAGDAANEGWVIILMIVGFLGTALVMGGGGTKSAADNDKFLVVGIIVSVLLVWLFLD